MTTNTISRPLRSASFVQEELLLCIAEGKDAARLLYALLKDEDQVEKVFGEFLVSVTAASATSIERPHHSELSIVYPCISVPGSSSPLLPRLNGRAQTLSTAHGTGELDGW
jgi:hypothetical protein